MTPRDSDFGHAGIPTGHDDEPAERLVAPPVVATEVVVEPPTTTADADEFAAAEPTSAAGVTLDGIPAAIAAVARGEAVVVVDDED
ncbi:MAG: hypothetical protein OEV20_06265, partial [Actinomycetota bacterium]|nr:hypothetical protein [Actinomycetota bacterium]